MEVKEVLPRRKHINCVSLIPETITDIFQNLDCNNCIFYSYPWFMLTYQTFSFLNRRHCHFFLIPWCPMYPTDSAFSLIFALKVALYCKEISSQSTNNVCAIENPLYFHVNKLYWLFTFCLLAKPTRWQNG